MLTSPGVEVSVIDESFYTSAEPGSVPLIVLATAENKLNGAGTAVAAGTLESNANNVYRITSQRELVETFGVPFFEKTATNNPVHGGERNEYGLLAAYSLLGVTNSVFVMRVNVDLNDLAPTTTEPGSEPKDGTWWVNSATSAWGIQEWNSNPVTSTGGQKFAVKTPTVLTDADTSKIDPLTRFPRESFGSIGDYAVVFKTVDSSSFRETDELAKLFFKTPGNGIASPGEWVLVGSEAWTASWPVTIGTGSFAIDADNDGAEFTINGVTITLATGDTANVVASKINDVLAIPGVIAQEVRGRLYLFSTGEADPLGDSSNDASITVGGLSANVKIAAGTYLVPKLVHAPHTQRPLFKKTENTNSVAGYPTGSLWIKTTEPNTGARIRVTRWNAGSKTWVPYESPMYQSAATALYQLDRQGGGSNIIVDTLYVQYNAREYAIDNVSPYETAEYRIFRRRNKGATVITSSVVADGAFSGSNRIVLQQSVPGKSELSQETPVLFTGVTGVGSGVDNANAFATAINGSVFVDADNNLVENNVTASVTADGRIVITHKTGGDIRFKVELGTALSIFQPYNIQNGAGTVNFYEVNTGLVTGSDDHYVASNWIPLAASISPTYYVSPSAPLEEPTNGQLWFNPTYSEVDLMIHNGNTWVGYKTVYETANATGPIISATAPELQTDGTSVLVEGDIWVSTADMENYPTIYRYNGDTEKWILVDNTDQTTEDGVLFADARINVDGLSNQPSSIVDLLTSNFLDFDAPDPALYPRGMILWNTRRSYGNVKRYANNYVNTANDNLRMPGSPSMTNYHPDRWVTFSENTEEGVGTFGRKAQRTVVVSALKSAIDTSEEARDEERRNFNLIACPGYPETLSNLVNLNNDRKVTAFVVGDTPLRLKPDATSLLNYGSNAAGVTDNSDAGMVTYDEYTAVYYPNGFTTDLGGSNVVVPASHMMLRTIILSDKASYPWFAPAGTRRGGITNATSVGYIDSITGEFKTVALNNGQRDTLYEQKINPIPFFVGIGHIAYGQRTRASDASALDRINVARLVIYLRSQLTKLARPFLFEPNDKKTRDEIKGSVESLMIELIGLRAIYDFAVVCDETNNTPSRIDQNQLWLDVAIEPSKSIEFIFIPLRLKNTGEI